MSEPIISTDPLKTALLLTINGLYNQIPPDEVDSGQTSFSNLKWMLETCIDDIDTMPVDKTSRWIGFVQGVLAARGFLDVNEELDRTRPFFHDAYMAMGLVTSETQNLG
jgi:hypothetical protein